MSARARPGPRSNRRGLAIGTLAAGVVAAVTTTALAFADTPPATGEETVTETIEVSGAFDGGNTRFVVRVRTARAV